MDELKPSQQIRLDSNQLLSGHLQQLAHREWIMYNLVEEPSIVQ
jgi:hypothetical protein